MCASSIFCIMTHLSTYLLLASLFHEYSLVHVSLHVCFMLVPCLFLSLSYSTVRTLFDLSLGEGDVSLLILKLFENSNNFCL